MLEDAAGIRRVVIACGYVDLRKGIDGLSMIIGDRYHQNPFDVYDLIFTMPRTKGSKKRPKTNITKDYASQSVFLV